MNKWDLASHRAQILLLFILWIGSSSFVTGSHKTRFNSIHYFSTFDTTLCGSSVVLSATAGLSNYKWSTGATTQSITVNSSGNYWWETTDYTANKVVNGNFSAGNTGFTSSYTNPPGPVTSSLLFAEGTYAVNSNPRNVHSRFASFFDHTLGTVSGNMMVVNGASVANVTVWNENVTVAANTTYIFSVWFASARPNSPGQLNFSINSVQLGTTIQLTSTTGLWQNFTTTWNSGSSTSASIGLINQNTAANGNDFAMDDVMFVPVYHHDIAVTLNPTPVLSVTNPTPACPVYNLTTALNGYDTNTYTYIFKDPSGNTITTANAQTISLSGAYTVIAQNKITGCQSASQTVTVTINSVPAKPNVTSP